MDDGDAAYEAEEPDEEVELRPRLGQRGKGREGRSQIRGHRGEGAHRSSPGAGGATDRPQAKAKAGSTSSTPVGLRMANTSVLNKLQERRIELEESLEKEAKATTPSLAKVSKLKLMLDQVRDQIKRAQELKKSKGEGKSVRLKADLAAGHNARLAKRKEKSRQSAALHRQNLRKAQAEARVGREETLERRFNVPERARKQDEYPLLPEAGGKVAAPPFSKKGSTRPMSSTSPGRGTGLSGP